MTDLHPLTLQEWNEIYGRRKMREDGPSIKCTEHIHPASYRPEFNDPRAIYGSRKMTTTFEEHPVPDGLAIGHEDVVERLRDFTFRFQQENIESGLFELMNDDVMDLINRDVETLNLAISALGGTPVKLAETEPGEGEDLSVLLKDIPF